MNRSLWGLPSGVGAWWEAVTARFRVSSTQYALAQLLLRIESIAPDVDIVLWPKGSGAVMLTPADGTTAGGNARGTNAVDMQLSRSTAAQVASGSRSFTAGYANTASSLATVALGYASTASSNHSTAIGYYNISSGLTAVTLGNSNIASGFYSSAQGNQATATLYGKHSVSSGRFSSNGDAQSAQQGLRRQTTDATPAVLTADAAAPSTTTIPVLPNSSTYAFEVVIVGHRTGTAMRAAWKLTGLISRDANAASTAIVGSVTSVTIADGSSGAWSVSATADTTNGGLSVNVTGAVGHNINWVATVTTTEVTG